MYLQEPEKTKKKTRRKWPRLGRSYSEKDTEDYRKGYPVCDLVLRISVKCVNKKMSGIICRLCKKFTETLYTEILSKKNIVNMTFCFNHSDQEGWNGYQWYGLFSASISLRNGLESIDQCKRRLQQHKETRVGVTMFVGLHYNMYMYQLYSYIMFSICIATDVSPFMHRERETTLH